MKYKLMILIIPILLLTGCNSYTELSDLSIVSGIGIDYQDNKYKLAINVINGKIDDGEIEKEITTYKSESSSLEEAFNDIYLKENKKLYLSHLDLLILSSNAVNYKLKEIISHFFQNNEYRNNFNVVLLKDTSILEFMNQDISMEEINDLINTNQKETSFSITKDFETMVKELLIDTNTYLPTITYPNQELTLNGFTLIKNYQIYDVLTKEESILLNLLENNLQKAFLNNQYIYDEKTRITSNKNNIYFSIYITTSINNNYDNDIKNKLNDFLSKYQLLGYDILKLCNMVRKNNYSYYKKTDNLLKKLNFNFDIKIIEKDNYLQGDMFNETK